MSSFPDDEDGEALAELEASGVDMSRPVSMDYFIDAPGAEAAAQIAQAAAAAGYAALVEYDEGEPDAPDEDDQAELGPSWTVCVGIEMIPSHAEVVRVQAALAKLAAPHGGVCDGWGVAVEEA